MVREILAKGVLPPYATEIAGKLIRDGGLVAFPTETVYGLGADALNAKSVARVYEIKGRPCDNPLIVHINGMSYFEEIIHNPPEYAFVLMENFWPGALTLVGRKKPELPAWFGGHPDKVTSTVGLRMPSHIIARELIKASGTAIAAPSANKAGRPSPTTSRHVLTDFPEITQAGNAFILLEADNSHLGIESTVVDITGEKPKILRPGFITAEQIFTACGLSPESAEFGDETAPRSPGMKYKHYAPRAEMTVLVGKPENIANYISKYTPEKSVGLLISDEVSRNLNISPGKYISMETAPELLAKNLYSYLRHFDERGVEVIFAEGIPAEGVGVAVMDRMTKAAGGRVVYVD